MSDYIVSPDAEFDLNDIWDYIAADSIDAADEWVGRLFNAFETIARSPGIGHKREDLTPYPVLFWPLGAYLIIYRVEGKSIQVVAVTQGSRDIPSFLRRRLH